LHVGLTPRDPRPPIEAFHHRTIRYPSVPTFQGQDEFRLTDKPTGPRFGVQRVLADTPATQLQQRMILVERLSRHA
jgi:hypothetical protein